MSRHHLGGYSLHFRTDDPSPGREWMPLLNLDSEPPAEAGPPREVLDFGSYGAYFDVLQDGSGLIVVKLGGTELPKLIITFDWVQRLDELDPSRQ